MLGDSALTVTDSIIEATAQTNTIGVYGYYADAVTVELVNVKVSATGGANFNAAVRTSSGAHDLTIRNSVVIAQGTGSVYALSAGTGASYKVAASQVTGIIGYPAAVTCVGAFDANYAALNTSSQ